MVLASQEPFSYTKRKEAEMATTATSTSDSSTASTATDEQDNTDTDQQDTEETSGQSTDTDQSQDTTPDPASKPDDKKDPAKAALLADLHKERKSLKTANTELTTLRTQVAELSPVKDTLDAVQSRYDRLEEFLQAAGGPLSKALDSRTFTKDLFESDKDIQDIVKAWHKANPSATSSALGSGPAAPAAKGPNMNDLIRSALHK